MNVLWLAPYPHPIRSSIRGHSAPWLTLQPTHHFSYKQQSLELDTELCFGPAEGIVKGNLNALSI